MERAGYNLLGEFGRGIEGVRGGGGARGRGRGAKRHSSCNYEAEKFGYLMTAVFVVTSLC